MYAFTFALALHTVGAILWVGGMAFSLLVLRPALGVLAPTERLVLWRRVLPLFFGWVWTSIALLVLSGYGVLLLGYRGGLGGGGLHIDIMQGTGALMILLFLYLFFGLWPDFRRAMAGGDLIEAARRLERIRKIVLTNLILGLLTSVVGATGTLWAY